jgi:hypothetical protein
MGHFNLKEGLDPDGGRKVSQKKVSPLERTTATNARRTNAIALAPWLTDGTLKIYSKAKTTAAKPPNTWRSNTWRSRFIEADSGFPLPYNTREEAEASAKYEESEATTFPVAVSTMK